MGKNLIQQARGKGGPRYRVPSFRFIGSSKLRPINKTPVNGIITEIHDCPGHSAPLIEVKYDDGVQCLMVAPEGIKVGDMITAGASEPTPGNVMTLKEIPEGTAISNIELAPGDGGKLCRSSGVVARVVAKTEKEATILLPSKREKNININCRAMVGTIAGSGRTEKPFLKAGTKHHAKTARNKRYPNPTGAAQNAVDHPFGNKRTSRKAKQKAVNKFAPPGRKVGKLWPRQTGRKK